MIKCNYYLNDLDQIRKIKNWRNMIKIRMCFGNILCLCLHD